MATRVFIDTNVLVYSIDRADPAKRKQALDWIATLARTGAGVISTQVLQEFYSAAVRKLGVAPLVAKEHVRDFRIFDTVVVTPEIISEGIDLSILDQLSFWDGLIVAAATTAGCSELLSEDMGDGRDIRGVTVRNPFA